MAASELKSFRTTELSALESQILKEKVKGLSDLEVALRLFLYEREVRAIIQKLKRRHVNSKIANHLNNAQNTI
jgi:DNA-binding CsgD family transcriptional regulator